jgi:transglutaminase-like putative cysteine protease
MALRTETTGRQRMLSVKHTTRYTYSQPIQRSVHCVHLRPFHDLRQTVSDHRLTIAPAVPVIEYEDVFGNRATRFEITSPYTELTLTAESTVALLDVNPFSFANVPIRPSFPLVWMPWEFMMLSPYLTPVELPESQLRELYDYAMSFVEQNNHDLMETLFAINLALFRQYKYVPGSTWLETTPFDVFTSKKGVCQDFANLFITMARLLGIPARYVCGYIYTGNQEQARAQSDASHAWVQLYIPNVGWKGFDPTNGVLQSTDHVKVAYGRHYRDATPTSGTVYTPAQETMTTAVEVKELGTEPASTAPAPEGASPAAKVSR